MHAVKIKVFIASLQSINVLLRVCAVVSTMAWPQKSSNPAMSPAGPTHVLVLYSQAKFPVLTLKADWQRNPV